MTAETMQIKQPLLAVEKVETYYGNIRALKGIDLTVNEGEIVALIGANGAGKSRVRAQAVFFSEAKTSRRCRHMRSQSSGSRSRRKVAVSSRA